MLELVVVMNRTRQCSPHGDIAISQVARDCGEYLFVAAFGFPCAVEAETSLHSPALMRPVGYGMSAGWFALPCRARQPQDARHVITRATDPALDLGQNVFPSAWD